MDLFKLLLLICSLSSWISTISVVNAGEADHGHGHGHDEGVEGRKAKPPPKVATKESFLPLFQEIDKKCASKANDCNKGFYCFGFTKANASPKTDLCWQKPSTQNPNCQVFGTIYWLTDCIYEVQFLMRLGPEETSSGWVSIRFVPEPPAMPPFTMVCHTHPAPARSGMKILKLGNWTEFDVIEPINQEERHPSLLWIREGFRSYVREQSWALCEFQLNGVAYGRRGGRRKCEYSFHGQHTKWQIVMDANLGNGSYKRQINRERDHFGPNWTTANIYPIHKPNYQVSSEPLDLFTCLQNGGSRGGGAAAAMMAATVAAAAVTLIGWWSLPVRGTIKLLI